jgi:hypothetical protein
MIYAFRATLLGLVTILGGALPLRAPLARAEDISRHVSASNPEGQFRGSGVIPLFTEEDSWKIISETGKYMQVVEFDGEWVGGDGEPSILRDHTIEHYDCARCMRQRVMALSPKQIVRNNKNAIVYLTVNGIDKNGVNMKVDATGFLVEPTGELITVYHIIQDKGGSLLGKIDIKGSPGSRYESLKEIQIIDKDEELDLMLLKFRGNQNNYSTVHICNMKNIDLGKCLLGIGYPMGYEMSVIDGILSSVSVDKDMYQTNIDFIAGYSGGPVFAENGAVVGVAMSGIPDVAGHNFFTPIRKATRILNGILNIPACDAYNRSNPNPQPGGIPTGGVGGGVPAPGTGPGTGPGTPSRPE